MKKFIKGLLASALVAGVAPAADQPSDHLVFEGIETRPGKGKHIVLLSGDEEYRSEESMPMLAQILAFHGFKATVLFAMDNEGKYVDPNNNKTLSNPAALDSADAIIMAIRWREWNDEAMKHFHDAFERGVPIIGLRTSTHPFKKRGGPYAKYGDGSGQEGGWDHGFGRHVLGEKWTYHHGRHAVEGARSVIEEENKDHPILKGVETIFARSDIYGANPRPPATILLRGEVTKTLEPDSPALKGDKNDPMQPVVWTREHEHENGKVSKIVMSTMGSADDLLDINLRRLVINSVYWGLEMDAPKVDNEKFAGLQNTYEPTMYGFKDEGDGIRKGYIKGKTPSDYIDWSSPKFKEWR